MLDFYPLAVVIATVGVHDSLDVRWWLLVAGVGNALKVNDQSIE